MSAVALVCLVLVTAPVPAQQRDPLQAAFNALGAHEVSTLHFEGFGATYSAGRACRCSRTNGDINLTPQGFLKAARANKATVRAVPQGTEVSFTAGGRRSSACINARDEVDRVQTWVDNQVRATCSSKRCSATTRRPERRALPDAHHPEPGRVSVARRVAVGRHRQQQIDIGVPDAVKTAKPPVVRVDVEKISDGVHYLRGGSHHSVAIEMQDHVVLVEAPLDAARASAVVAKVKELLPQKPIRAVVDTHSHFDHAGGLRTLVHEGATVVTHEANKPFFETAWAAPRTLNPDALAGSRKPAVFQTFADKHVLTDGARTIEVHRKLERGRASLDRDRLSALGRTREADHETAIRARSDCARRRRGHGDLAGAAGRGAAAGPWGRAGVSAGERRGEGGGQPLHGARPGRQHRRVGDGQRRAARRHQARQQRAGDPRRSEEGHRQARDLHRQHPHARRPHRQQPVLPGERQIVVHENTAANMAKMDVFKEAANKQGLADRTYKDKLTLFRGKEEVELRYFGAAHTDGDSFVVFKSARVMHSGDAFANKGQPFIDRGNGGSGVAYPATLKKAAREIKNVDKVIPGHSRRVAVAGLRGRRRVQPADARSRARGARGRTRRRSRR